MTAKQAERLAGLERLFVEVIDREGGAEYESFFLTRSREGIFSPALVMWLMVCQRLQERHSLVGALESLIEGGADITLKRNERSKRARRRDISANSGGLSRARYRINVNDVRTVCELISQHLMKKYVTKGQWRGKRPYIMDGTHLTLSHTDSIQKAFASGENQYREMHNSQILCMCFHDLFSGVALPPHFGPYRGPEAASEQELCKEMIGKLKESCLLLGDRNFGVFPVAYEAQRCGHDVLLRLTSIRAACVRGQPVGNKDVDEEVMWRPRDNTIKAHPAIPTDAAVKGRYIQKRITHPGCKPFMLMLFTTSHAPVAELVALYKQRTKIEHDIRSVKYTVGLEMLHSQTPAMIEKELLLGIAAYNLLRGLIAWAAIKLGVAPRDISFSRAAAFTRIFGNKMRAAASKEQEKDITKRYLIALGQSKIPKRAKYRVEPRVVVRKPRQFPLLKTTRAEARQLALQCLQKHGHRGYYTRISRKS